MLGTAERELTKDGKVKAYRCSHSGLYFPSNYTRQWGRDYGIGQGDRPVSEILNTEYLYPVCVPEPMPGSKQYHKAMHPVGITHAEVHYVEVDPAEYDNNMAILAKDDPDMQKRVAIIRQKQLAHPMSKIKGLLSLEGVEIK